jgi:hypothetical protein
MTVTYVTKLYVWERDFRGSAIVASNLNLYFIFALVAGKK